MATESFLWIRTCCLFHWYRCQSLMLWWWRWCCGDGDDNNNDEDDDGNDDDDNNDNDDWLSEYCNIHTAPTDGVRKLRYGHGKQGEIWCVFQEFRGNYFLYNNDIHINGLYVIQCYIGPQHNETAWYLQNHISQVLNHNKAHVDVSFQAFHE